MKEIHKIASMLSTRIKCEYDEKIFYNILVGVYDSMESITQEHHFEIKIPENVNVDTSHFCIKIYDKNKNIIECGFWFSYLDYPTPECYFIISSGEEFHLSTDALKTDNDSIKFILESLVNKHLIKQ